jgi:hypothetical protein
MQQKQPPGTEMLDHVWRYFQLHATQRMSVFNFFLVLSSLAVAGLAASLSRSGPPPLAGVVLGGFLALVSFVFWKLDQRTALLVKHAESALSELEASYLEEVARLFQREPARTHQFLGPGSAWRQQWTFGRSFRLLFFAVGLLGVSASLVSLARFLCWLDW